jgi:hypothetical protein
MAKGFFVATKARLCPALPPPLAGRKCRKTPSSTGYAPTATSAAGAPPTATPRRPVGAKNGSPKPNRRPFPLSIRTAGKHDPDLTVGARCYCPHRPVGAKSYSPKSTVFFAHVLRHSGTRVLSHPVNMGNLRNLRPFARPNFLVFTTHL